MSEVLLYISHFEPSLDALSSRSDVISSIKFIFFEQVARQTRTVPPR